MPEISRRTFLRLGAAAGTVAGGSVAAYASLIEPQDTTIERIRVPLRRLPPALDGLKIALISDLHFGPYTGESEISAAVAAINRLQPDLVAITGDFVTEPIISGDPRENARHIEPCGHILAGIHAPLGRFAVLGNHDHATDPDRVKDGLEGHGIPVLSNRHVAIETGGARLWVAGLDDALAEKANFNEALDGIPSSEPVLLLAHEPDVADHSARHSVDLQVSGHSHGGQILVPGVGALWLPPLARKYPKGLYQVGPLSLYTTRGVGLVGLPFRFGSPPEVTLIELGSALS